MSSKPKLRQNSKTFFKFVWPLIKAPNFFFLPKPQLNCISCRAGQHIFKNFDINSKLSKKNFFRVEKKQIHFFKKTGRGRNRVHPLSSNNRFKLSEKKQKLTKNTFFETKVFSDRLSKPLVRYTGHLNQ